MQNEMHFENAEKKLKKTVYYQAPNFEGETMSSAEIVFCLVYILVGQSIFWPALGYYVKSSAGDFPWLFIVVAGIAVTAIPFFYFIPIPHAPLPELSVLMENLPIKIIATGIVLLLFGGLNLRKNKSFIAPFALSLIFIFVGMLAYLST